MQGRGRGVQVVYALAGVLALGACQSGGGAPATAAAPAPAPELPAGVTSEMVTMGRGLFNDGACQRCHGAGGTGGTNGPSLVSGRWLHADGSIDGIARIIATGVPAGALKDQTRRFPMNPRGGPMNLTDTQIRAVAAYVWSISRRKG